MNSHRKWTGTKRITITGAALVLAMFTSAAMYTQMPNSIATNEAAAISTMRSIAAVQTAFKTALDIDTNCDGVGEYGYFAELAGLAPMRIGVVAPVSCVPAAGGAANFLAPPLLRFPFGMVMGSCVAHQGYLFQMWLPDMQAGGAVGARAEDWFGGKAAAPFPDSITGGQFWCCYAWPISYNQTGRRAFVINQRGHMLGYANQSPSPFSGRFNSPPFDEAYVVADDMSSPLRIGLAGGHSGSVWRPVP